MFELIQKFAVCLYKLETLIVLKMIQQTLCFISLWDYCNAYKPF